MTACLITLIFLGFGLMGWISGIIILIFLIIYICYVFASYYLAKNHNSVPSMATINFGDCKDTVENLDDNFLFSSSKKNLFPQKKKASNLISVDRNSLTPQFENEEKYDIFKFYFLIFIKIYVFNLLEK